MYARRKCRKPSPAGVHTPKRKRDCIFGLQRSRDLRSSRVISREIHFWRDAILRVISGATAIRQSPSEFIGLEELSIGMYFSVFK